MALRAATQTTQLGRYEIVQRLAEGGMADVLLARTVGIEGFERHVVIKRIRAEQARDARYVTMFLDEARLAASLHHANIVQVNDIGQDGGEYFLAMEYVHGEDVRRILQHVADADQRVPLEHVIAIVTAAAAGLHHAHEQITPDGAPLGIVHRDVSPANILIGYDGGVKVVDFGIAKATQSADETNSGLLKGKVSYMSPEQCNNEKLDRRSDVFALGIVLYELLTVQPLFQRANDFLTMSAIVNDTVPPPSGVFADIPPALDAIVMKALARSREDRYATADEMRRALEDFAHAAGVRMSSTGLADYMKALFGQRREPWLAERASTPLPLPLPAPPLGEDDETAHARPMGSDATGDDDLEIEIAGVPYEPTERRRVPTSHTRGYAKWIAGGVVTGAIALALVIVASMQRGSAASVARASRPATTQPAAIPHAAATPDHAPATSIVAVPVPVIAPVAAPTPAAADATTKKSRKKPAASAAKSKHWDPDALFPE